MSVRVPSVLLFALVALGCAGSRPPEPAVVERVVYLPAPVSPPAPCPPPGARHAKPKRHRHDPPRAASNARPRSHDGHAARVPADRGHGPRATRPSGYGHGPRASQAPRKPPTRVKLPHDRGQREKPRRSLRAEVPEGCTGLCRDEAKRRARECRRSFDRSEAIECIERLEHEMRRASAPARPKG